MNLFRNSGSRAVVGFDPIERLAITAYCVFSIALSLASGFLIDGGSWRFEFGRAVDRAGLMLFYATPTLTGVCIIFAQRRAAAIRALTTSLPNRRLAWSTSFLAPLIVATTLQVLTILAFFAVALASGANGRLPVSLFLIQMSMLVTSSVLGALIGFRIRTPLIAGVAPLAILGFALLAPDEKIRTFMTVGSGAFDTTFFDYTPQFISSHVLLALALALFAVPWRSDMRSPVGRVLRVSSGLVMAAAIVVAALAPASPLRDRSSSAEACVTQQPVICGPTSLDLDLTQVASTLQTAYAELPPAATDSLPKTWQLVGVGSGDSGGHSGRVRFEYSTEFRQSGDAIGWAVAAAMTTPPRCASSANLNQDWALNSAILRGHIETALGAKYSGAYPTDLVEKLEALPTSQRREVVIDLVDAVWGCTSINLGLLDA